MKRLAAFILVLTVCGCVGQQQQSAYSYTPPPRNPDCLLQQQSIFSDGVTIAATEIPTRQCASIGITYDSYEKIKEARTKDADMKLLKGKDRDSYISVTEIGGRLKIELETITLGHADPYYWTVVVEDANGNELVRKNNEHSTPFFTREYKITVWHNLFFVPIPHPIEGQIKVYVIDEILKKRWAFTVS